MKRIHLFEFEDSHQFPTFLRDSMTHYIVAIHRLLKTDEMLEDLLSPLLKAMNEPRIVDLCTGGGGPMPAVTERLRKHPELAHTRLELTDLFPNTEAAERINSQQKDWLGYRTQSLNAADVDADLPGLRTMICSLHHMTPQVAKRILQDAQDANQPFCAYEISDNSMPKVLWWLAIPFNIPLVFLVTLIVRPVRWQGLVFTYIFPILPLLIAWDGAVSNARTYTEEDMSELLPPKKEGYSWRTGSLPGRAGNKLFLIGEPAL